MVLFGPKCYTSSSNKYIKVVTLKKALPKIKVIDFFCGCGGTSAGLKQSGMQIVAGVDIDSNALATYSHNFPRAHIFNKSISDITFEELSIAINAYKESPILFAACAPCQPFSAQNRLKKVTDERISLLGEFHRFIDHFEPDYIILENVPGIQSVENGPFTRFLEFLDEKIYEYDFAIKNALDYGVPQSRKRLVLIASKKVISLPEETHGLNKKPHKTLRETIEKYPKLSAGEICGSVANHSSASLKEITLNRLKHTPEGGDRRNWPDELWLECHKNHIGHRDVYGRLSWDKPSVTLTTKCVSISNGRFGHPEQDRALSVREAAALQSFKDDFVFIGSTRDTAKQVGNAVPVDFAKALGDQVIKHMKEINNNG